MQAHIKASRLSVHLFRAILSGIFLVAGGNHLLQPGKTAARIEQANFKGIAYFFGEPPTLVFISGVVMLSAAGLFLLNIKPRYMAAVLIAVLIPITLTVQVGQITTLGPLFKNIAILGGLLFFLLNDTKNSINS